MNPELESMPGQCDVGDMQNGDCACVQKADEPSKPQEFRNMETKSRKKQKKKTDNSNATEENRKITALNQIPSHSEILNTNAKYVPE